MQFCDLGAQYSAYRSEIDAAVASVLASGRFIQGPQVESLERDLACFSGAQAACACANGSDALLACLHALEVEPGADIVVPDFTFFATAEMVVRAGARPVFADIDPHTFLVTPATIEAALTPTTCGIIAVSLFGQMPDLAALQELADRRGVWLLEDAAQSFGARRGQDRSCGTARLAATSFYPSKPLGCYGDGGAILGEAALVEKARVFCNHGLVGPGRHGLCGINSRLDAVQAAILAVKLRHFPGELERRREVAGWYTEALSATLRVPSVEEGCLSSWAQYTIRLPDREKARVGLEARKIPSMVHYPLPLHRQPAFSAQAWPDDLCPEAARAALEVLSLPMHPFLSREEVEQVATQLVDPPGF